MPMTIWFRPRRTQSSAIEQRHRARRRPPAEEAEPQRPGIERADEADIGADQHHALDADVEHAGLLRHLLAEAGQQQRDARGDGAEQQRGEEDFGEQALSCAQPSVDWLWRWSRYSASASTISRIATSTSVKMFGTPSRRAALSPPIDSTEKQEHEADRGKAVEARQEDQRDDRQAVGRVPVGAHIALDAEDVDGAGKARRARPRWRRRRGSAAAPSSPAWIAARGLAPTIRSFSPNAVRVITRCTTMMATRPNSRPLVMVVSNRRGSRSSTGSVRVCGTVVAGIEEDELDQHIGERGAEEGHHQRGDDLVDALIGAQQRRHQRPDRADQPRRAAKQTRSVSQAGIDCDQHRRAGRRGDGAEQELAVAAEIPDAGAERDDQAGGEQQQRRHARQRLLDAERREQPALAAHSRNRRAGRRRAASRIAPAMTSAARIGPSVISSRCGRMPRRAAAALAASSAGSVDRRRVDAHAASPIIRRPTLVRASSPFATVPTRRPLRHDGDAVGQLEQFVEVGRDQHDGEAARGGVADALARRERVGRSSP